MRRGVRDAATRSALAAEGANIIALDICADIENIKYPLARPEDLEETKRLVEKEAPRAVTYKANVREPSQVRAAIDGAVHELQRLDIVVANAGIVALGAALPADAFLDAVNVNFVGVVNVITSAYPHLRAGASIIVTGSVGAMIKGATDSKEGGPGGAGSPSPRRRRARFVHDLALALAPESIRVNAIHPCNVDTDLLHNEPLYRVFRPDLEAPTREDFEPTLAGNVPMAHPVGRTAGRQQRRTLPSIGRLQIHNGSTVARRRGRRTAAHTSAR